MTADNPVENVKFEYNGIHFEVLQARIPAANGLAIGFAINFALAILDDKNNPLFCLNNLAIKLVDGKPAFRSPAKKWEDKRSGGPRFMNTVIPYAGVDNEEERDHFVEQVLVPNLRKQIPITEQKFKNRSRQVPDSWYRD